LGTGSRHADFAYLSIDQGEISMAPNAAGPVRGGPAWVTVCTGRGQSVVSLPVIVQANRPERAEHRSRSFPAVTGAIRIAVPQRTRLVTPPPPPRRSGDHLGRRHHLESVRTGHRRLHTPNWPSHHVRRDPATSATAGRRIIRERAITVPLVTRTYIEHDGGYDRPPPDRLCLWPHGAASMAAQ
jgi:hypothetical protein